MHPKIAGKNWKLDEIIYDDGKEGIAVALFVRHEGELCMGFRWISDGKCMNIEGKKHPEWPIPYFGKSSEWILLPHGFALPIAKHLIVVNVAGNKKFNQKGYSKMIEMFKNDESIFDCIGF